MNIHVGNLGFEATEADSPTALSRSTKRALASIVGIVVVGKHRLT